VATTIKDATREDHAGVSLGVYDRGGDRRQPGELDRRLGDDEVIHGRCRGAIRLGDYARDRAGAVAVHRVSPLARYGSDRPGSSCRSSRGLVQDAGSRQIAFSIQNLCLESDSYVGAIVDDNRVGTLKASQGVGACWGLRIDRKSTRLNSSH